jgi:hypothetical protein
MISTAPTCQKCGRRSIVTYGVEPEEAWKTVVLNRLGGDLSKLFRSGS